jgi:periplasmic divalent cation tolerance protein
MAGGLWSAGSGDNLRVVVEIGGESAGQFPSTFAQDWPAPTRIYMTDKILVLTTAGSQDEARKIGRALVDRLLAACVNIVPQVTSIYRWEGEIEEAQEWLLIVKTTQAAFERVREAILELHSYDLPECVSGSIDDGNVAYLSWIGQSVK